MFFIQFILLCFLIGGGIIYLTTCLIALSGLAKTVRKEEKNYPTVVVVVAARNEENTIGNLLGDLSRQDYPTGKLRIIVVDDCSEDRTTEIVRQFAGADNRIQLKSTRNSQSPYSHKKRALHEGIQSSDSEIIITTDADCRIPPGWVSGMARHFAPGIDLVAGPVRVEGYGLTERLESLELTGIQAMAAGLMNAHFPVTCNGANLAYRRDAFDRACGFTGVGSVVSGDDDLLMQKIASNGASKVVFVTDRAVAVRTRASDDIPQFFNRRARWASKIGRYPSIPAVALMSVFFTFFTAVPVWLVLAVFGHVSFLPLIVSYGLKSAGDLLLTGAGAVKFGNPGDLLAFPLAEIVHVPYIIGVTIKGFFGSFEWRGRQTGAVNLECGKNADD